MSQSPKRESDSADGSAAKKTKISDTRPVMSDAEAAEFVAIRKQMMERLACVELGIAGCDDLDDEDTRIMFRSLGDVLNGIVSDRNKLAKLLGVE
jgi:hypothetical protein